MFDKGLTIHGTHAEKMKSLCSNFDENGNAFFRRNLDVYMLAPIVGLLYDCKAERDRTSNETANILYDQIAGETDSLQFIYRLIMLSDKKHESNLEERVNKAFRYFGNEEALPDEDLYDSYVLGGIDKIYDELMEKTACTDDFIANMYKFMNDFDMKNAMDE